MNKRVLCFDFGASGGRAVLSEFDSAKKIITAKEVHRFKNRGISVNGTLYWDILALFRVTPDQLSLVIACVEPSLFIILLPEQ